MNLAAIEQHNRAMTIRRRIESRATGSAPALPSSPPPVYVPPPSFHDSHVVEYRLFKAFAESRKIEAVRGGGISVREIIDETSKHFNVPVENIMSAVRKKPFLGPRRVAMYLARSLTNRSLSDIAQRFGGRDHTTVLHAVRMMQIDVDKGLDADVKAIEWRLTKRMEARRNSSSTAVH